jgi:hypothetical protein
VKETIEIGVTLRDEREGERPHAKRDRKRERNRDGHGERLESTRLEPLKGLSDHGVP